MLPPTFAAPDVPHWQPATFRERGVAVPFTSPGLAGARVRLLERRADLILPHPGGARGVYVFALTSLAEFCVPSMHDFLLAERLSDMPCFSPGGVRLAAAAVATEGTAGRAAVTAAQAAALADEERQKAYLRAFLASSQPEAEVAGDEGGQHQAVQQLARRTGRMPEAVMADITLLAAELASSAQDVPACACGPALPAGGGAASSASASAGSASAGSASAGASSAGASSAGASSAGASSAGLLAQPGRARNLLGAMAALAVEIQAWSKEEQSHPARTQLVSAACTMHVAGMLLLDRTGELLADTACLLGQWAVSRADVAALIGQLDWLLDGWEHICLLWRVSDSDEERAAALAEAALVLPPVPAEAEAWFPGQPALQARLKAHAQTGLAPGRPPRDPSSAVGLTARNERIRSRAA